MKQIKIAVIGHIDHGKSTTLGRLLFDLGQVKPEKIKEVREASKTNEIDYAYFLDNFEEERLGNMTIDVCYARFETKSREYVFIDTPGHKEFLKNMLSGASNAEAAVLLISAAPGEGIQQQTIRHLKLVRLLGIKQLLVVINKMDLVGYQKNVFEKNKEVASRLLKKIGFTKTIPFIPVSAKNGDNIFRISKKIGWYRGLTLWQNIRKTFHSLLALEKLPLRLLVQDTYSLAGRPIIVAKVGSGVLKKGENIIFSPSGQRIRVGAIKVGIREKKKAVAGEMVGLILAKSIKINRGEVASRVSDPIKALKKFNAQVYFLNEKKFKKAASFLLRCGLAETEAKIVQIKETEEGFGRIIITSKNPLVVEKYQDFPFLGRFVLTQKNRHLALGVRF